MPPPATTAHLPHHGLTIYTCCAHYWFCSPARSPCPLVSFLFHHLRLHCLLYHAACCTCTVAARCVLLPTTYTTWHFLFPARLPPRDCLSPFAEHTCHASFFRILPFPGGATYTVILFQFYFVHTYSLPAHTLLLRFTYFYVHVDFVTLPLPTIQSMYHNNTYHHTYHHYHTYLYTFHCSLTPYLHFAWFFYHHPFLLLPTLGLFLRSTTKSFVFYFSTIPMIGFYLPAHLPWDTTTTFRV